MRIVGGWVVWEKVEEGKIFKVLVNLSKESRLYLSCVGRTTEGF